MDSLSGLRALIAVVDAGGFSAAGRALGKSKALLSKNVSDLEDELAVRLLNRTTRRLSLTETGREVYEEGRRILAEIDALEDAARERAAIAKGKLRISAPRAMGEGPIVEAIMGFLAAYPDISAEISLEDRFVDLVEEGFDVAIRIMQPTDSSLVGRLLKPFAIGLVASPSLMEQLGSVSTPQDVAGLAAIVDTNTKSRANWAFDADGERMSVAVRARVEVNSPEAVRLAALQGLGIARIPIETVQEDLQAGRLVRLLEAYEPVTSGVYVMYPHRQHLSKRVRAFVDHMIAWSKSQS